MPPLVMGRRMVQRTVSTVALCGTLLAAACGANVTPSQLLSSADGNFTGLRSYRVTGGFFVNQTRVVISADVLAGGDATGTMTVESDVSHFVVVNRTTYFSLLAPSIVGSIDPTVQPILQRLNPPWWQAPGATAIQTVLSALPPRAFVAQFASNSSGLTERSQKDAHGRQATLLTSPAAKIFVSAGSPARLLEVTTAPHYMTEANFTDVDLVIDNFNEPLTVKAPDGAMPLDNLDVLPPYFTARGQDTKGCDLAGCTAEATVTALVGHGTSTVTINLLTTSDSVMASCTTPVSIGAVQQTVTVSCRATGSAWTDFASSAGGTYRVGATVANPAYGNAVLSPA